MRQLLLPSGAAANAAVPSTGATVSAAIACGTAARPSAVPATTADPAVGQRLRLESLIDPSPRLRRMDPSRASCALSERTRRKFRVSRLDVRLLSDTRN